MPYATPGVYIKEVSGGPRPIQAAGTSTAAFVGKAPDLDKHPHEAIPVNNWSQFLREFASDSNPVSTPLSQAVFGFFLNGGSRCYVNEHRRWARSPTSDHLQEVLDADGAVVVHVSRARVAVLRAGILPWCPRHSHPDQHEADHDGHNQRSLSHSVSPEGDGERTPLWGRRWEPATPPSRSSPPHGTLILAASHVGSWRPRSRTRQPCTAAPRSPD